MSLKRMPSVGKSLISRILALSSDTSMTSLPLSGRRRTKRGTRWPAGLQSYPGTATARKRPDAAPLQRAQAVDREPRRGDALLSVPVRDPRLFMLGVRLPVARTALAG